MIDRILIKFVKKANCWCRTTFENGKQIQEWFHNKPTKDEVHKAT